MAMNTILLIEIEMKKHCPLRETMQSQAAQDYNINAIPFSVLVDPNGIIVGKNLRGKGLEKKLEELYGKS